MIESVDILVIILDLDLEWNFVELQLCERSVIFSYWIWSLLGLFFLLGLGRLFEGLDYLSYRFDGIRIQASFKCDIVLFVWTHFFFCWIGFENDMVSIFSQLMLCQMNVLLCLTDFLLYGPVLGIQ